MQKKLAVLAMVALTALAGGAQAALITSLVDVDTTEDAPVLTTLTAGTTLALVDRAYVVDDAVGGTTFADLGLAGIEFVQTANDDKSLTDGTELYQITFGTDCTAYLFLDNRAETNLADATGLWVASSGFTDTGRDIVYVRDYTDRTKDININVYSASMTSGTVLSTYDIKGTSNMYTVVAVPEPATLSLLALGGIAMLRRRR